MPSRIAGPCPTPGCPNLADQCQRHRRTTSTRDYGRAHQAERRDWQRRIDSGEQVLCRRCKQPIPAFDPAAWDLGHPTPKHPECRGHNRATMGRDRS